MGSLTLDELLDATGISDIAGTQLEKNAAAAVPQRFSKLADRCRHAAVAAKSEEPPARDDLVEKTAAVAVIRRTLAEIQEIDGEPMTEKVAAATTDQAVFIRAALEEGHHPEDVARFLEKNAFIGEAIRKGKRLVRGAKYKVDDTVSSHMGKRMDKRLREWKDMAKEVSGESNAAKTKFLSSAYRTLDPEDLGKLFDENTAKSFQYLPYFRQTLGKVQGKPAVSFKMGDKGKEIGISGKQLRSVGGPAAMISGGAAVGHHMGKDKDKGSGSGGSRQVNISAG